MRDIKTTIEDLPTDVWLSRYEVLDLLSAVNHLETDSARAMRAIIANAAARERRRMEGKHDQ